MNETTITKPEFNKQAVVIERAIPDDAEAIMTLKRDAWLKAYTSKERDVTADDINNKFGDLETAIRNWRSGIASETEDSGKATFVARLSGKVVGYTSPSAEDGQKRLGALYVAPAEQGHGVGGKLLQQAVDWHGREQDIFVHVVSHNDNAISFYERYGFQKTGIVISEDFDEHQGTKLLEEVEMALRAQPATS